MGNNNPVFCVKNKMCVTAEGKQQTTNVNVIGLKKI